MGIFGNLFKPLPPSEEEAEKSATVIDNLRKRRGEETGRWLNMMSRDTRYIPAPGPAPTIEGVDQRDTINEAPYSPSLKSQYMTMSMPTVTNPTPEALANSEAAEWVGRLFAEFAMQSAAFNRSAQGTHLIINVHAPEYEIQSAQLGAYSPDKKMSTFKGHLATLQWGMLVQGDANKIQVYVVPSDQILDFTVHDIGKSFTPFMVIDSRDVDKTKEWHLDGSVITFDMIPLLAKELLGDLVRVASGNMSESELFSSHEHALRLGETVAQGFARPVPPIPAPVLEPTTGRFGGGAGGNANNLGAGSNTAKLATVAGLATWTVASQFLTTVDEDLLWLAQQKADAEQSKNTVNAQRLDQLITKLRTISGEIGQLTADYHQTGSKYNAT